MGDEVMAAFSTPIDAVEAAFRMMAEIGEFNRTSGEEELALEFFEVAWPEFAEEKQEALENFRKELADSPWYQQLAEQLDLGEEVTDQTAF